MHLHRSLPILLILIVLPSLFGIDDIAHASHNDPCAGESCPNLGVHTDKPSYLAGEIATIFGIVPDRIFKAGKPVIIEVFSPVDELVTVEVHPTSNGTFSYILPLDGTLPSITSTYYVVATYGEDITAETFTFMPEGVVDYECGFGACQYDVDFGDSSYLVDYVVNGIIQNITVDIQAKSLVIDVLVYSNTSFLNLSLNPELIAATELDETKHERDVNFTAMVNGKNPDKIISTFPLKDVSPGYDRHVVISKLEHGHNTVEIIGTRVIPEFDFTLLILSAVSIGTVAVGSRVIRRPHIIR